MTYLQRREVVSGLAGLTIGQALLGRARLAFAADKIKPNASSALIVVDVQNCFLPGGSLAVKDGDQVIPVINRIAKAFDNVVMTQDWHTHNHMSFASSYPDKKAFETIKVGPYDLCGGGCLSCDRREWVAGQGLGGHDRGWCQKDPVERSRYLNSACCSQLLHRTDE